MRASLTRIAGATTTCERLAQVAGRRRIARERLGLAQLAEHHAARVVPAGGSLSVRRSSRTAVPGAPSASAARAASRSSTTTAGSPAGSPRSRWAPTRVLRAPSAAKHQAGAPVTVGERGGGDPLVYRALHQRVDEAQRRRRREDLRGDQAIRGLTRSAARNPGQRGRLSQRGALEHRDRAGKVPRVGAEPVQPRHHRPRHRLRTHALDARGARRHRLDLLGFELGDQLPDQERVAGAGSRAGRAEIGVGVRPERGADERRDRFGAQRRRLDQDRAGIGAQRDQQFLDRRRLAVADGHDHQHAQLVAARAHVGEEPERRRIGPVAVVDDERAGPVVEMFEVSR